MKYTKWETCSKCGETFETAQACYNHFKECNKLEKENTAEDAII